MGVNSAALHFRERGEGRVELLRRHLALIEFTRRQSNEKSFMLDTRPRRPAKNMLCSSTHGGYSSVPCAQLQLELPPLRQRLPQTGRYVITGTDSAN